MDWFESPSGGIRWRGLKGWLSGIPKDKRQEAYDALCLKYPPFFFEALTEINPGIPTVLEEFQIKYLLDQSRYKISNKTRQAGGSLVVAASKFGYAYLNEGYNCDIVSVNRAEAQRNITYIKNLWESLPVRWRHPLDIDNYEKIAFHTGRKRSTIRAIAASAGVRGGKKDVVFDEAAHVPTFATLFVAALPATIRAGGRFDVVSTPLGQLGKYYEIWVNEGDKYSDWSRHEFTWIDVTAFCKDTHEARRVYEEEFDSNVDALVNGGELFEAFATDDLRKVAENLSADEFLQEFCGKFVDESASFFPYLLIDACRKFSPAEDRSDTNTEHNKNLLEPWFIRPEDNDHEVFMGIDFAEGKKGGDSTAIQVVEVDENQKLQQRYWADLDHKSGHDDFDRQIHAINELIGKFKPSRVRVDETGLGRKIAADLKSIHGGLIEPITFTNQNKEEMALNLKGIFEKQNIAIQNADKRLRGEMHDIKRKITAAGNITYAGEPHDDKFWALALACKGQNKKRFRILLLNP